MSSSPSATEEHRVDNVMHVKSVEALFSPVGVEWKFEESDACSAIVLATFKIASNYACRMGLREVGKRTKDPKQCHEKTPQTIIEPPSPCTVPNWHAGSMAS
ncbi:hypothetical protein TNCV_3886821 [Trichonephila clavipes]|nr:hypothetical protein TNCV_3886821 [Trichonephila clavipes]